MTKEEKALYHKEYDRKHYQERSAEKKAYGEKYRISHQKEIKAYREIHKEELREKSKKYYQEHKEETKVYDRKYYQEHKEEKKVYAKKWAKDNPEKVRVKQKRYDTKRRATSKGKLNNCMGTAIYQSLKGNKAGRKWETLVGYTLDNLMKHLENLFDKNMSWKNYGSYWWIDHIKPRSLFHYISYIDKEFKECWSLENLQPMEKITNIKKSNHYI